MSAIKTLQNKTKLIPMPKIHHWIVGFAIIICVLQIENDCWNNLKHAICYGILVPFGLAIIEKKTDIAVRGIKILSCLNAILFSAIIVVGSRIHATQDWSICFNNTTSLFRGCFQFISIAFALYYFILQIFRCCESKVYINEDKHFELRKWGLIILLVKLLFFAFFFPCSFDFDSATGLRTFLDPNSAICDHHPFLVQTIHAIGYFIGKETGYSWLGYAIITLSFILISTQILLYGLKQEIIFGTPYKWVLCTAITYAFFPLFPYLSVNINKDGFFAYFFLLYLFSLYKIHLSCGDCLKSTKFCFLHCTSIILLCLTRHQGVYIIIVEMIMLFFLYKKYYKTLSVIFIIPFAGLLIWAKGLLPAINVEPGGKQEALGLFFQQTAYYLIENPKDITNEESKAIEAVLSRDSIPYLYKSYIQDPVKRTYKYNPWYRPYYKGPSMFRHIEKNEEMQNLKNYMSAWISMGFRHPLSYLRAIFANTLGFFYNIDRPLIATEPYWSQNRSATGDTISFFHTNKVAEYYNRKITTWLQVPVFCWFLAIPYYNWIVIILLSLLLYRKDTIGLSLFSPVALSIFILFICPVAYGRYTYPIVISIPLLFTYLKCYHNNSTL